MIDDALCKKINSLVTNEQFVEAGNLVLKTTGRREECKSKSHAEKILWSLFQHLLDSDKYLLAATLQWGPDMFTTEPESVVRIFNALSTGSLVLLQGSSSMSKTYGAGGYLLMDYLRDPYYTTVKLAAINEDHLKKNLFAHVVTLYRALAIKAPYNIVVQDAALWIGIKEAGNEFGISGIAFKQSQETSGQFKGYKYKPVRKKKHPKFGYMSRLRVLGDECLPYRQKILMADGSEMAIGEIVENKISGMVASVNNETGKLENKRIVGWHKVKRKGRAIVSVNGALMTEDHPVLTEVGYVSAGHLNNYGLHCLQINEDLLGTGEAKSKSKIPIDRGIAWRCVNNPEFRPEGQCKGKVWSGGVPDWVSELEAGDNGRIRVGKNTRTVCNGMGRSDVLFQYDISSRDNEHSQYFLPGRKQQAPYNAGSSESNGRNGAGGVVHGRRRDKQNWENGNGEDIHICISRGRREAHSVISKLDWSGGEVSHGEEGAYNNSWSSRDGEINGNHKSIHAPRPKLQEGWPEMPREAIGISGHDERSNGELLRVRNAIQESPQGEDMLEAMQRDSHQESKDRSPQESEDVYCIDVEDNHNFFAGRVCVKNCQNWPSGPFKDFNTMVASKSGTDLVKIVCAFNPESISQHVVQIAEPEQGWNIDELDVLYDWNSKAGWRVCRLDAALSENVKQKKVVYPGLQTYEGYLSYLKAGGDNSPNYLTFARGFPPISGTVNCVIPPSWPTEARGEAVFTETPIDCGAADLAFMGKDSAMLAVGRWGMASGWRDQFGNFHEFKDRTNITQKKPRHVLQIDQLLPMQKSDSTVVMAEEIIGRCKMMRIKPEWLAVDRTGMGLGVHSHLVKVWGQSLGIAWNEKSTERKITAEDIDGADKQCDGVMSEMWWAFRKWVEPTCRAILINPIIPTNPIQTQLTSRRYKHGTRGIKVEPKEEYMARSGGVSPDEADAMVMLVHVVRKNSDVIPGLVEQQDNKKASNDKDGIRFYTIKQFASVERDDSISQDGNDNE